MVSPAELPKTSLLLPPEPVTAVERLFGATQVHLPSPGHLDQQNAFPGLMKNDQKEMGCFCRGMGLLRGGVPRGWCVPQSLIKHQRLLRGRV